MLTLALLGHALAAEPTDAETPPVDAPAAELATPAADAPTAQLAAPAPAALSRPDAEAEEQVPAALVPRTPVESTETAATRLVIVPGIGWNAQPDQSVEGFSTGVVAHGRDVEGLDVQWVGSWLTGTAHGVQLAMAYTVAQDVSGVQGALGFAWAKGDVDVAQLSVGASVAEGRVNGLQASTGLAWAGEGFQGLQASSGLNVAGGTSEGIQATAGVNVADRLDGVQAAPINVAREVKGLQLGLLNVGKQVDGVQLGLVNIAESSDVSIAPVNLVKDGLHRVDVWASESAMTTVAAKFGSKHVYTLLGTGWIRPDETWWTFGGGFGLHLQKDIVWTEFDASVWGVANGMRLAPGMHHKVRGSVGLELAPALQPFVGLSLNGWYGTGQIWPRAVELPMQRSPDRRYAMWPGAHVGVSF